ncbi:MAG: endolytic transglycosylase MltG [Oscillospiraceae bacterium]|nr:endolytic transglycosylase MltG [Oscillospiraceae bacterium]
MNSDQNQSQEKDQDIDESWDFGSIMDILGDPKKPEVPQEPEPQPQNQIQPKTQIQPTPQTPVQAPSPPVRRQTPAPGPRRPAPPQSQGLAQSTAKNPREANMSEGAQSGHTRKFDTQNKAASPPRSANPTAAKKNPDGTYHYTGRDIKSSRQQLKTAQGGEMSVSPNREKIKTKKKTEEAEAKKSGSIVSGLLKVVLYIVAVSVISGIIAYNMIMIANDVFAFMKTEVEAQIIIPEDATIAQIAQLLYEKELIKYPKIFDFYINYRRKDRDWEYEPGRYLVSSDTNYDDLIAIFRKKAAARETVRITIPEGYSIDEIITEFVDNNKIGTWEGFLEVINDHDFSEDYRFLKPLYETTLSPDRKYKLEGYLFPDTYEFYRDETELNIIIRLLNNFSSKFTENCYKQVEMLDKAYKEATGKGVTIDDIVTLASMVEWEAVKDEDFEKISAVFHNRLLAPASFPRLESDATVQYAHLERNYDEEKERYRYIRPTGDYLRLLLEQDEPYNTYKRGGLVPSAICNPGYEAIFAALWPEENSPYYYFVANVTTGEVYYGRNSAEHTANINRARAGE